jgi:hypothetical protein
MKGALSETIKFVTGRDADKILESAGKKVSGFVEGGKNFGKWAMELPGLAKQQVGEVIEETGEKIMGFTKLYDNVPHW